MTVLVGFGSRSGGTAQVAAEIAVRLRDFGLPVELRQVAGDEDLSDYQGVVLGSAVYSGSWLPEVAGLVARRSGVLAERPVWTFTVGRRSGQSGRRRREVWGEARETPEIHRLVPPRSHHFFPAIADPSTLPRRRRVRLRSVGGGYGDLRQRREVDSWANTIARQLLAAPEGERVPALAG